MVYKFKTTIKRSNLMRKIKSNKTTPELLLHKALSKEKIRYKKNYKKLVGSPDIVLLQDKIAIFIDGEFWHGYKWEDKKPRIKSNRGYWIPKIERTIARDKRYSRLLRKEGWKVLRFWQHQVKKDVEKCLKKIKKVVGASPR